MLQASSSNTSSYIFIEHWALSIEYGYARKIINDVNLVDCRACTGRDWTACYLYNFLGTMNSTTYYSRLPGKKMMVDSSALSANIKFSGGDHLPNKEGTLSLLVVLLLLQVSTHCNSTMNDVSFQVCKRATFQEARTMAVVVHVRRRRRRIRISRGVVVFQQACAREEGRSSFRPYLGCRWQR